MIPDSIILLGLVLSIFFLTTSTGHHLETTGDTK